MARDKAFLAGIFRKGIERGHSEKILEELSELTRSAGGMVAGTLTAHIERPTSNLFITRGKLEEIRSKTTAVKANLVIFNVDLSPVQARNIEAALGVRVVDRTGLIIDIFARRAQSRAGRLQVELAQLNYLLPRLVGRGVIMSRTGGGIGTRGPGEQKLEVDRRKIRERIGRVQKELVKLRSHQRLLRKQRKRKAFSVAAIVGYTNAGKSTLVNALTQSRIFVEDKLFATLDPTTRILEVPGSHGILLTDTVGFLVDLPHSLIEAFQATLDEVIEADCLIHVLDVSNAAYQDQHRAVLRVLEELGVHGKPSVLVLNKVDRLDELQMERASNAFPEGILISAKERLHLDRLIQAVQRMMTQEVNIR